MFDLNTDRRIRRYEFPAADTNANTFIANIVIDEGSTCDDTFAYFSDELGYGLIAYSWQENRSWRFTHGFFLPDPLLGDFNIAGLNFQWFEEGIFGMAVSPTQSDGFRTLFFSPIASHREFAVSTRVLRDSARVSDSYQDFKTVGTRGPNSHLTSKAINDQGLMFFNLIDQNAIGCWHSSLPYTPENHQVADKDDVGLVFPSDVKFDQSGNVWVISDRMPVFLEADLDFNDVNFRIYSASVSDMVRGTVCEVAPTFQQQISPVVYRPFGRPPQHSALTPAISYRQRYQPNINSLPWLNRHYRVNEQLY